jgi:hypothetical protein
MVTWLCLEVLAGMTMVRSRDGGAKRLTDVATGLARTVLMQRECLHKDG